MENTQPERRKKGPTPGPPTKPYTVMLEEEPAEWAKSLPGGLSRFFREFLKKEYEKAKKQGSAT